MDYNKNSNFGSRSEKKGQEKRRRANRLYNILLTIVILAIIIVAVSIFTGGNNDEQANQMSNNITEKNDTLNKESKEETVSNQDSVGESNQIDEDVPEEKTDQEATEENTVIENSGDSNVVETYVNDSWKPVGTTQTGEHITNYTKDSVDWQEMEKALAYGTGLSGDDMTVWYLENGGATNKAIGTVSPKDHSTTYRVYIEWIDGEGWVPTKVEKLKENDKISR